MDLHSGLIDMIYTFQLSWHRDIQQHWDSFQQQVDVLGDLDEGERASHQERNRDTGKTVHWNIMFQMDDGWIRLETYRTSEEDGVDGTSHSGSILELDEIDGEVQATFLRENETFDSDYDETIVRYMEAHEDGRFYYDEQREDTTTITRMQYFDPANQFYFERNQWPGITTSYKVYDPVTETIISTWIPETDEEVGYEFRFYEDFYPLLTLRYSPFFGAQNHYEAEWGLAACSGYETFSFVGYDQIQSHPWQSNDWQLHVMHTFAYLTRTGDDIQDLDGWLNAGHNTLSCDAISVETIASMLANISHTYFDDQLTPYLEQRMLSHNDLTIDESEYPR